MKKLLLICVFTLCYSYQAKAQTKEETITWLQEKLQTYMYWFQNGNVATEDLTIKVTECFITISYNTWYTGGYKSSGLYYIIPTDGVLFGYYQIQMKNGTESIRTESGFSNQASFGIKKGQENLLERLQKAVDHLATFCPKKEETF